MQRVGSKFIQSTGYIISVFLNCFLKKCPDNYDNFWTYNDGEQPLATPQKRIFPTAGYLYLSNH